MLHYLKCVAQWTLNLRRSVVDRAFRMQVWFKACKNVMCTTRLVTW